MRTEEIMVGTPQGLSAMLDLEGTPAPVLVASSTRWPALDDAGIGHDCFSTAGDAELPPEIRAHLKIICIENWLFSSTIAHNVVMRLETAGGHTSLHWGAVHQRISDSHEQKPRLLKPAVKQLVHLCK